MTSATEPTRLGEEDLLVVRGLHRTFARPSGFLSPPLETVALKGVSFGLRRGEILGVVGESGCGKSTLARIIVGLETADAGSVHLGGSALIDVEKRQSVPASRRGIQMVFQDPYASLNPRMRVQDIVGEGLAIAGKLSKAERQERVSAMLATVGLSPQDGERYPHQFSGGQRQRIGIARSLVMQPRLLVADEAVSALDVSVQMQVLNLMLDIRERLGISMMFITHNIGVVEYLCDRVIVLSQGGIVESGETRSVIADPQHPYTQRLIAAVPQL
ncbi:MAG TPA: ATP-binding cassette domain-containing protein [Bosea sp. (in: a-proteobacteria)]|jgi:ABC-type glutathione transport system ATPase component|uniref:ATP-binding cassette domain-containing protein n=1 Tax=Bosea sp. (in: a-proteobacteria) TaxID=1871050 RepID=UPI002E0D4D95|nr:ATP-binding cassette domain-containing protein [Bosea sp. (in: a-proteobacteria)]